jgi:hypothetical protein
MLILKLVSIINFKMSMDLLIFNFTVNMVNYLLINEKLDLLIFIIKNLI